MQTLKTVFLCLAIVPPLAVAQSAGSSNSIDLLSFAIPDAKIVAGANLAAARSSAFGQFVLSQIQSVNPALQKFITDTGIDPRTDLTAVAVTTDGMPGPSLHVLAAAHGTFSNVIVILEAAAGLNGGTVTHDSGVDVISIGQDQGNLFGQSVCIALYTDGATAVIGDCDSVNAGIASTAKPLASTNLLTAAQQLRSEDDFWFTSILPLGQFATAVPPALDTVLNSQLIQAIQQTSGGVKFVAASTSQGPTVQLSGDALMDTSQNATSLGNVVKFLVSMIQMMGGKDPAAAPFLNLLSSLLTSVSGSTLNVSLTIPESMLEQLFEQLHQQASGEPSSDREFHHRHVL